MRKNIKKFLALIFAVIIGVGGFGNLGQTEAAVNNVTNVTSQTVVSGAVAGQQEFIQDGVTLHCWNWSYKNIEANMELIAASGYTAIQTSPIQQCKEGTSHQSMDAWWLYYQPMGFHIDNTGKSALGTKAEFESMVETAHQYGVKVIVDVVANHLANSTGNDLSSAIIDDIEKDPSCWHDYTKNTGNYESRYEVTQYCMAGLPDLNTWNRKVQDYVVGYLKECIDAGVDGFRFDAAKHIEVPVDTDNCASEFWPYVINSANTYATTKGKMMYYYGELLDNPGGGIPSSAYTTYMSITDNSWSNQLRGYVGSGNAGGYSAGYHKGNDVYADKLVLWAESHDTFAGGESKEVSTNNINKTWALVAARNSAMGLYFARPSSNNLLAVPMGSASATGWSDAEVVAVNKFHNEFVGKGEYIANENGIGYCERGDSGVVLVNFSGNEALVNVKANAIKDGTYKDQITGNTFIVSGGRITGEIGGTGIAVVYNPTTANAAKKNIAYIELPSSWGSNVSCYVYGSDGTSNADWPGVAMTKVSDSLYMYEVPASITNPRVIFYSSDTNRYPADLQPGLSLWGSMIYEDGQWVVYSTGEDSSGGSSSGGSSSGGDSSSGGNSSGGSSSGGDSSSGGNSSGGSSSGGDSSSSGNSSGGDSPSGGNSSGGSSSGGDSSDNSSGENSSEDNSSGDDSSSDNSGDSSNNNDNSDNSNNDNGNNTDDSQSGEENDSNNDNSQNSDNNVDTPIDEGDNPDNGNDSSSDATTETGDDGDDGKDGKNFPWPAIVIPLGLVAVGVGVILYIKINKAES